MIPDRHFPHDKECKVYPFEGINYTAEEINRLLAAIDNKVSRGEIKDGCSAYQVAVKNGYKGTEEEWLASLRGPRGEALKFADLTNQEVEEIRGPKGNDGLSGTADNLIVVNDLNGEGNTPEKAYVLGASVGPELQRKIDRQKNEVYAARDEALTNIADKENNALEAIADKEESAISNFSNQRVTPEMLSESTKQFIEASGGGSVTNLADDEDIESRETDTGIEVLKFADRKYNPQTFSGKGYKILRKNIQRVVDYDKITEYAEVDTVVCQEVTAEVGQLTGDPDGIALCASLNRIYGYKSTDGITKYYTSWTGTKYPLANYIQDGKPIEQVYKLTGEYTYYIFTNDAFIIYNEAAGAPIKSVNSLTQTMINKENTVYEIRYDFDLLGQDLTIPANSDLKFNGGSLKNGTLFFKDNNNIYNPFNNTIFFNIGFSCYSKLSKSCTFIDSWHNDPFLGEYTVFSNVPKFVFTKDYIISDDAHFWQRYSFNNITNYIQGNGHSLTILSHKLTGKKNFLQNRQIICNDLTIICRSDDLEEHIGVIFNCESAVFKNVSFDAYNRLVANWSYTGEEDKESSYCIFENCKCLTSSFIVEGPFDKIDINGSTIEKREEKNDYHYDIISTTANQTSPTIYNAYIRIRNSIVKGGIELAVGNIPSTKTYKSVKVENSILTYFRLGTDIAFVDYGISELEVSKCTCYIGEGNGFYNSMKSIKYTNCIFYLTDLDMYKLGPFVLMGVKSVMFETCLFTVANNYTKNGTFLCRTHDMDTYPENHAASLKISFINCEIDNRFINDEGFNCIDLSRGNLNFTDSQAENNIKIVECKILNNYNKNKPIYCGISYKKDDKETEPRLLPFQNFVITNEMLNRVKLNMIKKSNTQIKGTLINYSYLLGSKSIGITYSPTTQQWISSFGLDWNSVKILI